VLGGRLPFDQTLDPFVCRLLEQRFRAAPLAVIEGHSSLSGEAIDDSVDGGVREQKSTRAISVGDKPSAASRMMCILSLLLERLSRFISMMRSLRSCGAIVILCMDGRFFGGWMDVASLPCHTERPSVQLSCASI
jgi:hypothetical protein